MRMLTVSLAILGISSLAGAEIPAQTLAEIRALVEEAREDGDVPGISVSAVVANEPAWAEGFGLADVENAKPATPDTIYRIASISKMLTATAAMQLVEAGKLDLNRPIQEYTTDFPQKQWPITLHHLLAHQSGIRHWRTREEANNRERYPDIVSSLASFKEEPLLFEPGTQDEYSTPGYNVVGRLIEVASGQSFADYMRENVFEPAGMTTTAPAWLDDGRPEAAARYRGSPRGPRPSPEHDVSIKLPGGGFSATAPDLARFASALMNGELVSQKSLDLMWTEKLTDAGATTHKGYGCNLGEEKGRAVVWHIGGLIGASGILYIYPAEGHAVAVLTNQRATDVFPLAGSIMDALVRYTE